MARRRSGRHPASPHRDRPRPHLSRRRRAIPPQSSRWRCSAADPKVGSVTEPIVDAAPALDFDLKSLPKVSLHDHLDGGLRPATIIELAEAAGHTLPSTDPVALGEWFRESADSGSLVRYLETFDHTVAVMQTKEGLFRVAKEFVEDLADDGVVYGEVRWAPEQHLPEGPDPGRGCRGRAGRPRSRRRRRRRDRPRNPGRPADHRHAPRRPRPGDRRTRRPPPQQGRRRLRHRRCRGRLPAVPLQGRLHLPGPAQLPRHRPRRRGRRAGEHPVRAGRRPRPAPGPRRPHRRGHHGGIRATTTTPTVPTATTTTSAW